MEGISDAELEIDTKKLKFKYKDIYLLSLDLPIEINRDSTKAKFEKAKKILTLTADIVHKQQKMPEKKVDENMEIINEEEEKRKEEEKKKKEEEERIKKEMKEKIKKEEEEKMKVEEDKRKKKEKEIIKENENYLSDENDNEINIKNENAENQENVENQEYQEENQENIENQENQEDNQENQEIQENQENQDNIQNDIEEKEEKDEIENEDEQENVTFLSRFFMQPNELYSKDKYLLSIMRLSIFERILRIFLFQSTSKELSLFPFLDNIQNDPKMLKLYDDTLKFISDNFTEDFPLYFFNEVVKEINRITKIGDLSNMKFDKYILKLEFLLAWHFENNFL